MELPPCAVMRSTKLLAIALLFSCPQQPAGPGPGGAERYVAADDGSAVLWIPEGATTADNITVTRVADENAVVYDLQPEGLQFAIPAVLFIRTNGASPDRDDASAPASLQLLQGTVTSAGGSAEVVQTVRSAMSGNAGSQHGLTAVVVPHFTRVDLTLTRDFFLTASLDDRGHPTFRREVSSPWSATFTIRRSAVGPLSPSSLSYTVEAHGHLLLTGAPGPHMLSRSSGRDEIPVPVQCTPNEGPGSLRLVLRTELGQLLVLHLAGKCVRNPAATELEGAVESAALTNEAAVTELLNGVLQPLAEPRPTLPAEPIRALAPLAPEPEYSSTLELPCVECPLNVPQQGRFRITGNVPPPSVDALHVRMSSSAPVSIESPSAVWMTPGPSGGSISDFTFTYTCTAAGTATLTPSLMALPLSKGSPMDAERITGPGGHLTVFPFKGMDGKNFALVSCGSPTNDTRVAVLDQAPVLRTGAAWSRGASEAAVRSCVPNNLKQLGLSMHTALEAGTGSCTTPAPVANPLQVSTGTQVFTLAYDPGTRTLQPGPLTGPAFGPNGGFTIQANPNGGPPIILTVPAPGELPALDPVFSAPAGWDTRITYPDGHASHIGIFAAMQPPPGAAPGTYGLNSVFPSSEVPLINGRRELPLLDPAARDLVLATGWTPIRVNVELINSVSSSQFFPGQPAVPFQAIRRYQFSGETLFGGGGGAGGAGGQGGQGGASGSGGGTGGGGGGGQSSGGGAGGGSAGGGSAGGGTAGGGSAGGGSAGTGSAGGGTAGGSAGGGSAGGGSAGGGSAGGTGGGSASTYDAGPSLWDGGTVLDGGTWGWGPPTYTAAAYLGQTPPDGARLSGVCNSPGVLWTAWGTGIYDLSSSLCTAAFHAGRVTLSGGPITIEVRPGPSEFRSTTANGFTSYYSNNSSFTRKGFVFVP